MADRSKLQTLSATTTTTSAELDDDSSNDIVFLEQVDASGVKQSASSSRENSDPGSPTAERNREMADDELPSGQRVEEDVRPPAPSSSGITSRDIMERFCMPKLTPPSFCAINDVGRGKMVYQSLPASKLVKKTTSRKASNKPLPKGQQTLGAIRSADGSGNSFQWHIGGESAQLATTSTQPPASKRSAGDDGGGYSFNKKAKGEASSSCGKQMLLTSYECSGTKTGSGPDDSDSRAGSGQRVEGGSVAAPSNIGKAPLLVVKLQKSGDSADDVDAAMAPDESWRTHVNDLRQHFSGGRLVLPRNNDLVRRVLQRTEMLYEDMHLHSLALPSPTITVDESSAPIDVSKVLQVTHLLWLLQELRNVSGDISWFRSSGVPTFEQMLGCFVEPCAPEDSEQADETGPLIGHHYTVALHIFLQVFLLKEPFIGMTIGDLPMHKIVGVNDADVSLYVSRCLLKKFVDWEEENCRPTGPALVEEDKDRWREFTLTTQLHLPRFLEKLKTKELSRWRKRDQLSYLFVWSQLTLLSPHVGKALDEVLVEWADVKRCARSIGHELAAKRTELAKSGTAGQGESEPNVAGRQLEAEQHRLQRQLTRLENEEAAIQTKSARFEAFCAQTHGPRVLGVDRYRSIYFTLPEPSNSIAGRGRRKRADEHTKAERFRIFVLLSGAAVRAWRPGSEDSDPYGATDALVNCIPSSSSSRVFYLNKTAGASDIVRSDCEVFAAKSARAVAADMRCLLDAADAAVLTGSTMSDDSDSEDETTPRFGRKDSLSTNDTSGFLEVEDDTGQASFSSRHLLTYPSRESIQQLLGALNDYGARESILKERLSDWLSELEGDDVEEVGSTAANSIAATTSRKATPSNAADECGSVDGADADEAKERQFSMIDLRKRVILLAIDLGDEVQSRGLLATESVARFALSKASEWLEEPTRQTTTSIGQAVHAFAEHCILKDHLTSFGADRINRGSMKIARSWDELYTHIYLFAKFGVKQYGKGSRRTSALEEPSRRVTRRTAAALVGAGEDDSGAAPVKQTFTDIESRYDVLLLDDDDDDEAQGESAAKGASAGAKDGDTGQSDSDYVESESPVEEKQSSSEVDRTVGTDDGSAERKNQAKLSRRERAERRRRNRSPTERRSSRRNESERVSARRSTRSQRRVGRVTWFSDDEDDKGN